MTLTTTTHLNFRGTAREALEHYRSVLGGSLTAATYADLGMPQDAPGADRLVFGQLDTPGGLRLMAYDVPGEPAPGLAGPAGTTRRENGLTLTDHPFFLSLRGQSLAEVTPLWEGLAAGGRVVEPLAASPWSPGFGMLTDRYGVTWVVDVEAPHAG